MLGWVVKVDWVGLGPEDWTRVRVSGVTVCIHLDYLPNNERTSSVPRRGPVICPHRRTSAPDACLLQMTAIGDICARRLCLGFRGYGLCVGLLSSGLVLMG